MHYTCTNLHYLNALATTTNNNNIRRKKLDKRQYYLVELAKTDKAYGVQSTMFEFEFEFEFIDFTFHMQKYYR